MKKIFAVAVLTAVFTVSGFAQVQTEKVVTTGSSGREQSDEKVFRFMRAHLRRAAPILALLHRNLNVI